MRPTLRLALLALLCGSFLTACSRSQPLAVAPVQLRVPASLLECPAEPPAPAVGVDDNTLALWIIDTRDAGESCRAALRGVKTVVPHG